MTRINPVTIDFSPDERCDTQIKKYLGEIVEVICSATGDKLKSLVLMGAMPTGEASACFSEDNDFIFLSDFDFLAITHTELSSSEKNRLADTIKAQFSNKNKQLSDIGISYVTEEYLPTLPPAVSTYGTKNKGLVVYGEPSVLKSIPDYTPSQISKMDAIIYTQNRSLEELFSKGIIDGKISLTKESFLNIIYHSCKAIIDFNLSLIAFLGQHQPTYNERLQKLKELWSGDELKALKSAVPEFLDEVSFWTNFKITPSFEVLKKRYAVNINDETSMRACAKEIWEKTLKISNAIWRFEWLSYLGVETKELLTLTNIELAYKIVKIESLPRRIVRWIKFIERKEADNAMILYSRLLHLIVTASPRQLFYTSSMLLYYSYSSAISKEEISKILRFFKLHYPLKVICKDAHNEAVQDCYRKLAIYMMKKIIAKENVTLEEII